MKINKLIVSLLALPLVVGLSSCSTGDNSYSNQTSRTTPSSGSNPMTGDVASGEMVFDFLLNPGSSFEYNGVTDPETFKANGVDFTKSSEDDFYTATIAGESVNASALYLADVDFDGHRDICIGVVDVGENRERYFSVSIFDTNNNKKLIELKDHGNFDYDLSLDNSCLTIEEMPYVPRGQHRSVSRVGRFNKNTEQPNHLEWESSSYKLTGLTFLPNIVCAEDKSVVNTYKDTNGDNVYVFNTTNTFEITVSITYQGDYATNTKQKGDCITFDVANKSKYSATFVSDEENGKFVYKLAFNSEDKFSLKISVEKFDTIIPIEVNNTLYDQLKVA